MNDKAKSSETEFEPEILDETVEAQGQLDESEKNEESSVVDEEIDFGQFDDDSREELIEKLVAATSQVGEMRDGFIRARADVENIQRRSQNEMVSARKFAVEGFARELLSVVDSLDQASKVEMDENSSDAVSRMKEGLELTLKQFESVMEKFGVVSLQAEVGV
jgi:molecular chaperone GrpE